MSDTNRQEFPCTSNYKMIGFVLIIVGLFTAAPFGLMLVLAIGFFIYARRIEDDFYFANGFRNEAHFNSTVEPSPAGYRRRHWKRRAGFSRAHTRTPASYPMRTQTVQQPMRTQVQSSVQAPVRDDVQQSVNREVQSPIQEVRKEPIQEVATESIQPPVLDGPNKPEFQFCTGCGFKYEYFKRFCSDCGMMSQHPQKK